MVQSEMFTAVAFCQRCGVACQPGEGSAEARLLRRARKGLCVNCAVTHFLKTTVPLNAVLAAKGPEMLRDPRVREQFANAMRSGQADAGPDEINWDTVVDNWNMP